MREYELIIDEALKNGLSPELMIPFNSQFLYKCYGFRCGRMGLEPEPLGSNPIPSTIEMYYNWPFPQVLIGDTYNILVVRNTSTGKDLVYSFSDDHSTFTLAAEVNSFDLFELADFGEFALLTNGESFVFWNPATVSWQTATSITDTPIIGTICNLRGQAIGGNVKTTWHDCDETFYIWSKIGEMDFVPGCDNEAGYRRCPYGGTVYHTKILGDNVVGYSSKGITLMHTAIVGDCGPAVMGFKPISDVGLLSKGAMAGDLSKHVYVGEDYRLREITSEGIKELGYQQWMESLGASEEIIVTYDRINKNFYIGNSSKTFLLSPIGLTESMHHPSASWVKDGILYILPDSLDNDYYQITTVPFDFGYSGQKTIMTIEGDAIQVVGPEAAVDCSYDLQNWMNSNFTPINNMGIATIFAAGGYFRFKVRFKSIDDNFRIGYIKSRYKMTDLRGIRGIYAPSPRGQ